MAIELAWHDLIHRRARTTAALGGVLFAIVLIFMQVGFYLACRDSATRIHALLDFDAVITSARYAFVADADRLPRERLEQARAVPGVERVSAIRIGPTLWRSGGADNRYDTIFIGVDPIDRPFLLARITDQLDRLQHLDTVLYDHLAHPVLGRNPTGSFAEVAGRRLDIVGGFQWGAGFAANALVITSDRTFANLFPAKPLDHLQLGLIHLAPEAAEKEVLRDLEARLPNDVEVWSRAAIEARDRRFFLSERPIGLMFTSGVVLALLVGGIILFQVLASEVTSRRSEFATLQALGYSRAHVYRVVVAQGFLYTVTAFLPACLCAFALFWLVRRLARLPMQLTLGLSLSVLGLSLAMCLAGALLASRRVRSADPADLF